MKKICIYICLFFTQILYAEYEAQFAIIVTSYNNEPWCLKNIASCTNQVYPNWTLYYINDGSTDNTGHLVEEYIHEHNLQDRCIVIHNASKTGVLKNIYNIVHLLDPHTIVVLVDGADCLSTPLVLHHLERVYNSQATWITYGNFINYPSYTPTNYSQFPDNVVSKKQFRKYKWSAIHSKTFYAGLFQKIESYDLKHENKFFSASWDFAMMIPMLEMASKGHVTFIPTLLYMHNESKYSQTDSSHHTEQRKLQGLYTEIIRKKTPYPAILDPF